MNVPKLRFKEFNDEWCLRTLNELYTFKNGINGDKTQFGKGIKYISVGDILNNNYITYDKIKGLIDIDDKTLHENSVEFGDILFQRSSETKKEIGMSNVYLDNKLSTFGGFVIRGKKNKDNNNNPCFINYLLRSQTVRKDIVFRGAGAQHYNIGQEDLKKVSINIPSLAEQNKISSILQLLDKKIELQTKKINDLKLFKKGLLYSIFNKKKTNTNIENCIDYGKAGGTPLSSNKDYYDGNIPFLSISDITNQGKYIFSTEKMISQKGLDNSSAWLIPKNSLILSMYASYGLVAINKIELSTSQAMFNMIINKSNNVEYIYYYLKYLYQNNYYDRLVSTGTQSNLNADKVKKIKIYLPNIEEQNALSKIFICLDKKINFESNKLNKLIKLKKGLIQNMFV